MGNILLTAATLDGMDIYTGVTPLPSFEAGSTYDVSYTFTQDNPTFERDEIYNIVVTDETFGVMDCDTQNITSCSGATVTCTASWPAEAGLYAPNSVTVDAMVNGAAESWSFSAIYFQVTEADEGDCRSGASALFFGDKDCVE